MTERQQIAHLLRRAGLGASQSEVDYYLQLGYNQAVQTLLESQDLPADEEERILQTLQGEDSSLRMPHVKMWWVFRLLTTRAPLRERMTLFWHNYFATSASKVVLPTLMFAQNRTLRQHALGRFGDLLLAISRDPAMLIWLDNRLNRKGNPNENYARELLELFTLGIGNYTEHDVREAARAFTGWTWRPQRGFVFLPAWHDDGEKLFLGHRGRFNGQDIINILAQHPKTAERVCTQLFRFFAYETPEPPVIRALVQTYIHSGGHIAAVVKQILLSQSFRSPKAIRTIVKSPVDFVVPTLRCLGVGQWLDNLWRGSVLSASSRLLLRFVDQSLQRMGMNLFYPPSVKGWEWGKAWINSSTMSERLRFLREITSENVVGRLLYPLWAGAVEKAFVEGGNEAGLEQICQLVDAQLPTPVQQSLLRNLQAHANGWTPAQKARWMMRLVCATAEYQMM